MSDFPELVNSSGNYLIGSAIALSTKANRPIPNERRPEQPNIRLQSAKEMWTRRFPEIRVRSLSGVYNCMGMVFASRRTYVDPETSLEMILRDDEYKRITLDDLGEGDIVIYRDGSGIPTHVGIVTRLGVYLPGGTREVWVLSQWGALGEYLHKVDQVADLLGKPAEYWTDRRWS